MRSFRSSYFRLSFRPLLRFRVCLGFAISRLRFTFWAGSVVSRLRRFCCVPLVGLTLLSVSVVSRRVVSFGALGVAPQHSSYRISQTK